MLVIRMQRTGRKGHAMFRVVVQDSRRTPTSGKIVASLGSHDPHAKTVAINKEKAQFYLEHGAQPSERVAMLLKKEGIKLPDWVKVADKKAGTLRNPDKLRRNRPPEPVAEVAEPVEEAAPEVPPEATESPAPEAAAPAAETESVASAEAAKPTAATETTESPEKPEEQAAP